MGDLNIDTSGKTKDTSCYLSHLRDTFSLKNIILETHRHIDRYIAHKYTKKFFKEGHF